MGTVSGIERNQKSLGWLKHEKYMRMRIVAHNFIIFNTIFFSLVFTDLNVFFFSVFRYDYV